MPKPMTPSADAVALAWTLIEEWYDDSTSLANPLIQLLYQPLAQAIAAALTEAAEGARVQAVENDSMARVVRLWPTDSANYPGLDGTRGAYIGHVILHMSKDTGKLAAAMEPVDHGKDEDGAALYRSARNMLVNSLRLIALLEVKPSQLLDEYEGEIAAALRALVGAGA